MNSWQTLFVAIVSLVLGGGGTAAIVTSLAKRRVTKVDAADRLNESTLEWAAQLKADTVDLRHQLSSASQETTQLRAQMYELQREAEAATRELRRLRMAIMDPYTTLDRLRGMVGDPGANGILNPH